MVQLFTEMRPPPMVQEVLKAMHKKKSRNNDKKEDITVQTALPSPNISLYPSHLLARFLPTSRYSYLPYGIPSSGLPLPYGYSPAFSGHYGLPFLSPYAPYPPNILLLPSNPPPDSHLRIDTSVNTGSLTSLPILPSNPVEMGSLSDYIAWHIKRDLIYKKTIFDCITCLAIKILRSTKRFKHGKEWQNEKKWERLNIEPGIGIRVAHNLKSWAKTDSIAICVPKSISSRSPPPINQQQLPRMY